MEGGRAWQFYAAAQTHILNQIAKEKDQRRLFLIDTKTKRLEQMQHDLTMRESNLKERETRVFEAEPYRGVAKKLQNLGLDMGLALPWIEVIRRKAEVENVDIRACATKLSQELTQYGSVQKQIESANQELALINMATIRKKHALTVVEDLISRGVTSEQIIQLINFAGEWDRYSTLLQQPNGSSNNNSSNPPSSIPGPVNNGNNGHIDLSMNNWMKLNFLKGSTSNMLNKMAPRYNYSDFHGGVLSEMLRYRL